MPGRDRHEEIVPDVRPPLSKLPNTRWGNKESGRGTTHGFLIMRSDTLKTVALFGVLLLIAAVAIANIVPPANRYEISLYGAYPIYFWALLLGAMVIGALVIIGSSGRSDGRSWMFGLYVMLLSTMLLVVLPFVRGYYMYFRGDPLTHIGYTIDILNAGEPNNIYPLMHLLTVALSDATGFELRTTAMFLPLVFCVIYFGAMYYLLPRLFQSRRQILLALPFVMLPVLRRAHTEFRPFGFSVVLLPLVLYLLIASQRTSAIGVRIAFVITLVSMLLYHPLTALFAIGIFAIWFLSRYVPRISAEDLTPTSVVSISAAVFLAWYSNFTGVILRFERVYEALFGTAGGESPADGYTQTVQEASPPLIDLIRVAVFGLGLEFLLFGLGLAFIAVVTYLVLNRRSTPDTFVFLFAAALAVFSVGGLAFLTMDLIVPHQRPFQVAKVFGVVLVGGLFYILLNQVERPRHGSKVRTSIVVVLLVTMMLLAGLSVTGVHRSPAAGESNHQITDMEFKSADWITEHGTTTDGYLQAGFSYHRFSDALYGTQNPPGDLSGGQSAPNHFNYHEYSFIGEGYTDDQYLLISHRQRIFYQEVYPDFQENWRFTPGDFDRLEQDRTTARIYDNGDKTQYLIEGTGS